MNGFAPAHVTVLRALGDIWSPDRFIVIGAAAVGFHIGMNWRGTLEPDGTTMNLLGFRLAFEDAIPFEIGPATEIRVASLRSIVVLKVSAYLDKPWERETDLADDTDRLATLGRMARRAPTGWKDPESLRSRFRALGQGLGV